MEFIAVAVILIFVLLYNKVLDTKSFLNDVSPWVEKLMSFYLELNIKIKT